MEKIFEDALGDIMFVEYEDELFIYHLTILDDAVTLTSECKTPDPHCPVLRENNEDFWIELSHSFIYLKGNTAEENLSVFERQLEALAIASDFFAKIYEIKKRRPRPSFFYAMLFFFFFFFFMRIIMVA